MKLGQFTIHYLDGGYTHMDGGAIFGVVPKPLWSRKIESMTRTKFLNRPIRYSFKLKM